MKNQMQKIVFEISKEDTSSIERAKSCAGQGLFDEYPSNGLDGMEIITIATALTPSAVEVAMELLPKTTVTIKYTTDFGVVEVSSSSVKKAKKQLEQALKELEDIKKDG